MTSLDPRSLAAHILSSLAEAQIEGRRPELGSLAAEVGVRRTDVRSILSRLHAEGHVDATRLRLTLTGFALGESLRGSRLRAVRARTVTAKVA